MGSATDDIKRLLNDCELFVSDILQEENLSPDGTEARDILLNNFRVFHSRYGFVSLPLAESKQEDSSDDNQGSNLGLSGPSDNQSLASDTQEEGYPDYLEEISIVAVQDLGNILKQGYLEKKRRDHSFFGSEWQKRWCVLNNAILYYFGSEKDKQQKGAFHIKGYSAEQVANLRKDSKRNCCFELSAPGSRSFQFTAGSPQEAREWVSQINFVLKDLSSNYIPCEDYEEEGEEDDEDTYDDIMEKSMATPPRPVPFQAQHHSQAHARAPPGSPAEWKDQQGDEEEEDEEDEDDIYEVLPEDDFPDPVDEIGENKSEYARFYQGLWDCQADEPDELTFHRGDVINIISKEYNIHGWWVGELNGTIGIVPKDFMYPAYIV
ncbi:src kinase-associated phosphoprotein 1 [Aplochiton taeniatus]